MIMLQLLSSSVEQISVVMTFLYVYLFVWIYSSTLCNMQLFLKSRGKFAYNLKPKMVNEQSEPFPPLWARRGAHTRSVKLSKITLVLAIVK